MHDLWLQRHGAVAQLLRWRLDLHGRKYVDDLCPRRELWPGRLQWLRLDGLPFGLRRIDRTVFARHYTLNIGRTPG